MALFGDCCFVLFVPPTSFVMRELEMNRHTIIDWEKFCREFMYDGVVAHKVKIGGVGVEVTKISLVNENTIGSTHGKKGQNDPIKNSKEWILPETTIISDCWNAYDCFNEEGFVHFKVNHSINFKYPETDQHTNTIEGL
ncbi:DDE Tnp IS1595 domain-containing protein [Aphis craccivora]|uniref:DDE Tnp IS1595 domain-containing protein n=1 Tax=Aphis craccivora TaxID=307492 RepID=A0A6G0W2W0_APHCR|nr:DDE Tnp IS1595 domain-containing protein [Aphis craccivora]